MQDTAFKDRNHDFKKFFHVAADAIEAGSTLPLSVSMQHPAYLATALEAERCLDAGLLRDREVWRRWLNLVIDCGIHPPADWEERLDALIRETAGPQHRTLKKENKNGRY